ncbi:MAG: hypothetical protein DRQ55_06120 [Planctomycetota bacterium]|nr:MAG: hypothetical protein DRQ55_06120 [Planctomycetota bacterium]
MTTHETLAVAPAATAPSPALASLGVLERLLGMVGQLTDDLSQYLPTIRRRKAFLSGRWVVGLAVGGGMTGRTAYTRLDVELELSDGGRRVRLTTRKTVRDHDLLRGVFETALDEAGWLSAEAFLQDEFLTFAESWFDRR